MKEPASVLKRSLTRLSEHSRWTAAQLFEQAAAHFVLGVAGFLCAGGSVSERYWPFGIAAVAGCPSPVLPAVTLGALIGNWLTPVATGRFRITAVLLAVVAVRIITDRLRRAKEPWFAAVLALGVDLCASLAALHGLPGGFAFAVTESLLAGGGAFFVRRGSLVLSGDHVGLTTEEMTGVVLCLGMVLLGLFRFSVLGIPVGYTIAVFLMLIAARYGHAGAGAVWGIVCALLVYQTGGETGWCMAFCLGGLLAGLFSDLGKLGQTAALCAAALLALLPSFGRAPLFNQGVAFGLGAVLFLALPKTVLARFAGLFAGRMAFVKPDGLIKGLTMRLRFAGSALGDVSGTVEQVASKLAAVNVPDFHRVLEQIEQDACGGCSLRRLCWESRHDETVAAVLVMTKAIKRGDALLPQACDEEFRGRCMRPEHVAEATRRHYTDYMARFAAEQRVEEVRGVVADQFAGIAQMLQSLAADFETDERFDTLAAARIGKALQSLHLAPKECGVRLDQNDRMTVEVRLATKSDAVLNKAAVMQALSAAVDRTFDPPCLTVLGKDTFMSISEHARYTADVGVYQINCNGCGVCGDAYETFFDGKGNLLLLLSDGMGTGGRAAVDATCAASLLSRLIKAGFGYDAALKILNASMLFKSTDESCASVDLVVIDLFTGQTRLLKAGAAPTLVRRGGRAGKAQSSSLPAGILRGIGFDKALITLRQGDAVLLLSDGAVSEGTDWIAEELESFRDGRAKDLARKIARSAQRRRTDGHEDDITVMAAFLEKAP